MDPQYLTTLIYAGIAGALLGSFANVCIYRLPRGESVVFPPSHCPGCQRPIAWYDNIPIFSYLRLRGKCRRCRVKISPEYPIVETLTMALFVAVAARFAATPGPLFFAGALTLTLIIMSVIDIHLQIIPDVISLGILCVALAVAPLNPLLAEGMGSRALHAVGAAGAGFGLLLAMSAVGHWVFRKEALGGGDIKLMAGLGAALGLMGVFETMFTASVLGTLTFAVLKLRRRMDWGAYLPFGPFLAAGAWVRLLWPGLWTRWWGF